MKALLLARKSWKMLLSVVLLSLAFPPFNASLLVLVALAPWMAHLRDCEAKGARRSGYAFGFFYFLFQMFWLIPFVSNWTKSVPLSMIPWILSGLIVGCYYMLVGWGIHLCWSRRVVWAIPLVWSGIEAFRSYLDTLAFPWGLVAYPLWRFPAVVQQASWGTIFFVSSLIVMLNLIIACTVWPSDDPVKRTSPRLLSGAFGFIVVTVLLSLWRYTKPQKGIEHRYLIAQPGVDQAFGDESTRDSRMEEAVGVLLMQGIAEGVDTVVFPEGIGGISETFPPTGPVQPMGDLSFLYGGNRKQGEDVYQSAYAYDGEWKVADKTRLVIFGEFVPFRNFLPFLSSFNVPSGDLVPAKKLTTLEIDGIKTGAMICFEGVFPDLAARHGQNGAQVLVVMAIDDWYVGTMAHEQLAGSTVWRSIESGLPLLRSASTGTSLVTDSRGRVLKMAPEGGLVGMEATVVVPERQDGFAYRFGFVWVCWLAMLYVAWPRRRVSTPADR